ncbi:MAG: deoxyribose-phosphate aldolase [Ignavibacteriales bacterium]|nr:deoxyribose-phosphate aldolase [Ignavibacteriales bacterium]
MPKKRLPTRSVSVRKRPAVAVSQNRSGPAARRTQTHGIHTNTPVPFDPGLVQSLRVNRSAVEARAIELGTRRTFKVEAQVAAYLSAIRCIDLTTLAGDDTPGRVTRLCMKALVPLEREIIAALGLKEHITTAAVCVYPAQVQTAAQCLAGRLPVASVATGFPSGQTFMRVKLIEIDLAIKAGATEIDVVISREKVLTGKWKSLYDEIVAYREVCGTRAKLKTILGVGNLETLSNIAAASAVAIMAGSDTIKTSTGFEPTNAALPSGLVMVRQIRRFMDLGVLRGRRVGFKPAGGIRSAKDSMLWLTLMLEELGIAWTKPDLFRIGASGLLTDIERQLRHLAFGRYSNAQYHPMA